ncbi:hypothetical protein N9164_14340, partial [Draconibacterium sp.]|nr:hypothetical protein [Draconibacterium sp.]
ELNIDDISLDEMVIEEIKRQHSGTYPIMPEPVDEFPKSGSIDLSDHLHFIRRQGGAGCWGYSMLAIWDIMNEMACPFSPNLSMRLWMMLHRRRELWSNNNPKGIFSPDCRYHKMTNPEWGFLQSFGNTTEGTEPTLHNYPALWPDGGWSKEGINEADNYRLKSSPKSIVVSSDSFINCLSGGFPIRLCYEIIYTKDGQVKKSGHFIAVVGYDLNKKEFKYVNSVGDKWNNGGMGTFTFSEVDDCQLNNSSLGNHKITSAEIVEIFPPEPVPVARIHIKHTNRANLHLWLGIEDSPHPKNQIWPHGWNDNSSNLYFTVRLPGEFIWPPSKSNRIVLEIFDAGTYSQSGGELIELTVAFGLHTFSALQLPVKFNSGDRKVVYVS